MRASDALLSRLDGVRAVGEGRWRARCPSHGSKGRTLGIREEPDGRVLLHCFAGCEVSAILGAVGLTMNSLFPTALRNPHRESGAFAALRRIFDAEDVIDAMREELLLVQICASSMGRGECLTPETRARLRTSAARIHAALDAAGRPMTRRRVA